MFTTMVEPTREVRQVLDEVVVPPPCPLGHEDGNVIRKGSYKTASGLRQRYRCDLPDGSFHRFTAPLPRGQVTPDVHCDDCGLPTPTNAGPEASARRNTFPMRVIHQCLRDLADGKSYADTSLWVLEASGKPTGRVRRVRNGSEDDSPKRDARAHWHVSVDMLEQFGPPIVEAAFAGIDAEQDEFRARDLPVIYTADEAPVKRKWAYRRQVSSRDKVTQVWTGMVVSRVKWGRGAGPESRNTSRAHRLLRVRALPSPTQAAWEIVFSELQPPDYLVADGAGAIMRAAEAVWGDRTLFVPCMYHVMANLREAITPRRGVLPGKVADHVAGLSGKALTANGPGMVADWFDELDRLLDVEDMPRQGLWRLRKRHEPLLRKTAVIAQDHQRPWVPLSNSGVETLMRESVSRLTEGRGPMFTNLPRTNLLGDLMVAGSNGFLNDEHAVAVMLRAANRDAGGWSTPPRALNEPAGLMGLRNPGVIREIREQVGL